MFFSRRDPLINFIVFSSLTLPSIAAMILPQTRDHMFPHANTFIIWLVSLIGIIWSFDHISKMLSSKYNSSCMLLLLSAHTLSIQRDRFRLWIGVFPSLKKQRIGSRKTLPKTVSLSPPTLVGTSCISSQSKMGAVAYTNGMATSTTNLQASICSCF